AVELHVAGAVAVDQAEHAALAERPGQVRAAVREGVELSVQAQDADVPAAEVADEPAADRHLVDPRPDVLAHHEPGPAISRHAAFQVFGSATMPLPALSGML